MVSNAIRDEKVRPTIKECSSSVMGIASGACFVCGAVLMLASLMLWLIGYFERMRFDGTETVMLVSSFVLFARGAHFLDCFEAQDRASRE